MEHNPIQTAESEHLKRLEKYKKEIETIDYDYHYTRKVKQATIELAELYVKRGYAAAAILPPLHWEVDINNIVETAALPQIRMQPIVTGNAVQDLWNIWSEAESVAYRSTPKLIRS